MDLKLFDAASIRHPEVEFLRYRCKECRHIFSIPKTKYQRVDMLRINMLNIFSDREKCLCPECGSKDLEEWNPERSFLKSITQKTRIRPKDGSIISCDYNFISIHSGIYVKKLGVIHIPRKLHTPKVVRLKDFINIGIFPNFCKNIYISCYNKEAIASKEASQRARYAISVDTAHFQDCHAFVAWCLTGEVPPKKILFSFPALEYVMGSTTNFNNWMSYSK